MEQSPEISPQIYDQLILHTGADIKGIVFLANSAGTTAYPYAKKHDPQPLTLVLYTKLTLKKKGLQA